MSSTSVTSVNSIEPLEQVPERFDEPQPTGADAYAKSSKPMAINTREAECQLIGYVLAHPAAATDEVLSLPAAHMSSEAHATLWKIAVERSDAGHTEFDPSGVMAKIRDEHSEMPNLPEQASKYAITYGFGGHGVVLTSLCADVTRGHIAREAEQTLMQAWQQLGYGRADEALQIMSGVDPTAGATDRWMTLGQAWESAKTEAENPAAIIPTPWKQINKAFEGGMRAGHVYVLAGLAGTGKTASAQQVIDHAAGLGYSVGVFSLEMRHTDLARRQLSTSGHVPMSEVMRPDLRLSKEAVQAVDGVISNIGDQVFIDDTEELTISELRSRARAVVRRHKAGLLVVDYAQLVGHDNTKLSEREVISAVVQGITVMSKELSVPVLLLTQPNRNAAYQDRKLEITDLHGSSALEKFAAGVILLNKEMEEDETGNKVHTGFVDFDIRKNRFGQNDVSVRMLADLSRQRFEEMTQG